MIKLLLVLSIFVQSILIANNEELKTEDKMKDLEDQKKVQELEKRAKNADANVEKAQKELDEAKRKLEQARANLEDAKIEASKVKTETREVKNEIEDKKPKKIQETEDKLIILKDKSGLSETQVREKAANLDKEAEAVSIDKVIETIVDADGKKKIDISKIQKEWKDLSPKSQNFDWVQTKSGEWFKGEIKTLYRDELIFDSDEIGLYTFDFDDIEQIKSHQMIAVNIDGVAIFEGLIRYKEDKISIIQGDKRYIFDRYMVVSLAPEDKSEISKWSGKITASLDIRSGNSDQKDFSAQANISRLTSKNRLTFDYLGRTSEKSGEETANDHRLNQKYDEFITRKFFWTPFFSELYKDKFKNIKIQATGGVGIGYILVDEKDVDWDISGGPAYIHTEYQDVEPGQSKTSGSPALELSTNYEHKLTNRVDFIYAYQLTWTDTDAGTYKHHMVTTFENEITDWLDLDITYVWDYIADPEKESDGSVPDSDDHQVLIGLGIEF